MFENSGIMGLFTSPTVGGFAESLKPQMVAQPAGTSFSDYVQQLISTQPANVKDGMFYNPRLDEISAARKANAMTPGFSQATPGTPAGGGGGDGAGTQTVSLGYAAHGGMGPGFVSNAAMQGLQSGLQFGLAPGLLSAAYSGWDASNTVNNAIQDYGNAYQDLGNSFAVDQAAQDVADYADNTDADGVGQGDMGMGMDSSDPGADGYW